MAAVLEISEKDPLSTLNYLANIHENKDFNFHVLKWNNCVVLRNCNKKGELIQLNKNSDSIPWILLTLKPFKFKNIVYPIFSCSQCSPNILKMSIEHDPADFGSILCAHSKVATRLVGISTNSQNVRDSIMFLEMMIRITVTKIFQVTQILLMEYSPLVAAVRCRSPTDWS